MHQFKSWPLGKAGWSLIWAVNFLGEPHSQLSVQEFTDGGWFPWKPVVNYEVICRTGCVFILHSSLNSIRYRVRGALVASKVGTEHRRLHNCSIIGFFMLFASLLHAFTTLISIITSFPISSPEVFPSFSPFHFPPLKLRDKIESEIVSGKS